MSVNVLFARLEEIESLLRDGVITHAHAADMVCSLMDDIWRQGVESDEE